MSDDRKAFNPLDRVELGRSVGRALLLSPCEPLPPSDRFYGVGIYALYYQGDFDAYEPISLPDCEWPIYVGSAAASGGRTGAVSPATSPKRRLYERLRQHFNSIRAARNLDEEDFRCRYLVVDDIWVPLAERLLIAHYRPLWNGVVEGFGGHAPGGKPGGNESRAGQQKSIWDTLHPGRGFAKGRKPRTRASDIRKRIAAHLSEHPPQRGEPPTLGEDPIEL